MKYDIDILGPYPPPFGGVSIHVKRLHEVLQSRGVVSRVFDQYSSYDIEKDVYPTKMRAAWWLSYFFRNKPEVVHFHIFSYVQYLYIFLLSYCSKSKIIISIHNERILSTPTVLRFFVIALIRTSRIKKCIVVSETVFDRFKGWGVKSIQWIPAYIPPEFISKKELQVGRGVKVFYNASTLKSEESRSVYSLDMIFHLSKQNNACDFHIFIGEEETGALTEILSEINNYKNTYFYYNKNMIDYMHAADVFIRPNRVDAFGISVQESLDLGVPAIASDVCTRSKGAILFPSGDVGKLNDILHATLNQDRSQSLRGYQPTTYVDEMIKLYASLGMIIHEH
jgi:glycosyltransferase involved in cell wall biosynthesis